MKTTERQIFSRLAASRARASHLRFALGAVIACAALTSAQFVSAAPVMPTLPNHLWLLDAYTPVNPSANLWGNATPDAVGGLKLYGARANGTVAIVSCCQIVS